MEKTISIRNTEITFSIWDLGGQREFVNMLPLVCNDAVAILFMFDLTRKSTLNSIKEWYRQGRGFNKTAIPFLVGTKYDHFVNFPREEQEEISLQAKRFAKAMKASLIFSSTSHSINVQKVRPRPLRSVCNRELTPFLDFQDCPLQGLRPTMHHSRDRERRRAASTIPGCVARRRHRHTHPQSTAGLLRQLRLDGGSSVSDTNVTPLLLHVTSRDGEKRSKTHEQQARTRMKKCLYAGEMRTTACITAQKRCFVFLSSRLFRIPCYHHQHQYNTTRRLLLHTGFESVLERRV